MIFTRMLLCLPTLLCALSFVGCKSGLQGSSVLSSKKYPVKWGVIHASNPSFKHYLPGIYSTAYIVQPHLSRTPACTGVVIARSENVATILTHAKCGSLSYNRTHPSNPIVRTKCSQKVVAYFNAIKGIEKHLVEARCVDGSMASGKPYPIITFQVQGEIPDHIRPLTISKKLLTDKRPAYIVHHARAYEHDDKAVPEIPLSSEQEERFDYWPNYARLTTDKCYVINKDDQVGLRAFLAEKFPPGRYEDRKEKRRLDELSAGIISGIRNHIEGGYKGFHLHTCTHWSIGGRGAPVIDAKTHELLGLAIGGEKQIRVDEYIGSDGSIGVEVEADSGSSAGSFFIRRAVTAQSLRKIFSIP